MQLTPRHAELQPPEAQADPHESILTPVHPSASTNYNSCSNTILQVRNPATGSLLATMPRMRADETRAAIAAAHAVLPQWRHMPARERAAILRRCVPVRQHTRGT